MKNENQTPFYQDKTFYLTALGFTIFGYLILPKIIKLYQSYRSE